MAITILGIESSCDDTSAAVIQDGTLLSNIIAGQSVHERFGGVVPELASRAHQENIIPVVNAAVEDANIKISDISAIAFTRGPGLLGSLLVGTTFAKGMALAGNIPLIDVNHLSGHILSHYIKQADKEFVAPEFPHLCLLVSGGHTQILLVKNYFETEIIGQTIDDAAGEAFDKCAKTMGLPYPGGPQIDKLSKVGDKYKFKFARPLPSGLDFSFSGLKTSFLYLIRDYIENDPNFIEKEKANLAASLQYTIIEILSDKILKASKETGIKTITLSGGVSANSELREKMKEIAEKRKLKMFIPELKFTTDNAAMIAIAGYFKYKQGCFANLNISPSADLKF